MTDRQGKTLALIATVAAAVIVLARDAQAGKVQPQKLIGVAIWGGSATLLAGFAPLLGASLAGLLLADVAILPAGSASLFDSLLTRNITGAPVAPPGPTNPIFGQPGEPGFGPSLPQSPAQVPALAPLPQASPGQGRGNLGRPI